MHRLIGGLLLAIGILIAGTSGLCSLTFVVTMMADTTRMTEIVTGLPFMLMLVGMFGGVPFLVGLALIRVGKGFLRRAQEDDDRYR